MRDSRVPPCVKTFIYHSVTKSNLISEQEKDDLIDNRQHLASTMMAVGRIFPMASAVTALLLSLLLQSASVSALNLAPFFTDDMNQHTLKENTPVGTVVYQLLGEDPEGSPVTFGIEGTKKLRVDPRSGQVTVAEEIDRESPVGELGLSNDNEIRLTVIIQGCIQYYLISIHILARCHQSFNLILDTK